MITYSLRSPPVAVVWQNIETILIGRHNAARHASEHSGFHREIYYEVKTDAISSGLWRYLFVAGNDTKTGTIKAPLGLLAVRRVRMLIDWALRERQD